MNTTPFDDARESPGGHPRRGTLDELRGLLRRFDTAMLVSRSLEGELRARPMAVVERTENPETLCFVTNTESAKVDEVLEQPKSLVTFERGSTFLSLSGEAAIEIPGPEEAEMLWQPGWRLWFPEGPRSGDIALVRFRIRFAEYWDRSGINGLRFFWRATRALSREATVDDQALPGHGKLDLRGGSGERR